jgi:hypothetical protein
MLNLRQVGENSNNPRTSHEMAQRSTLRFHANFIVGNMGESLDFGAQRHNEDLEDEIDEDVGAYPGSSMPLQVLSNHEMDADAEVSGHGVTVLDRDVLILHLGCLSSMIYDGDIYNWSSSFSRSKTHIQGSRYSLTNKAHIFLTCNVLHNKQHSESSCSLLLYILCSER